MNATAHSSNRHYREEFEPRMARAVVWRVKPLTLVVLAALLILALLAAMVAGAALWENSTQAEARARIHAEQEIARIPRPAPAKGEAFTQWTCEPRERAEYVEACKRRALSALVKPKER